MFGGAYLRSRTIRKAFETFVEVKSDIYRQEAKSIDSERKDLANLVLYRLLYKETEGTLDIADP